MQEQDRSVVSVAGYPVTRQVRLSRRSVLRSVLGASSVLLLAACAPAAAPPPTAAPAPTPPTATQPPAATTAPAVSPTVAPVPTNPAPVAQPSAANLIPVTVAMSQTSGSFLPNYIALDGGIYQQNGLAVTQSVAESTASMASLLSGQITFAETGGPEIVNAVAGGADVVAVATLVPVYPYRLEAAASIQKPEDLKGAKIGITNFGSTIDIATRLCLSKMNVDVKDVTLLPLGSVSARTAALLSGQIAAGLSQPPDWLVLEAKGFHSIFDMAASKIPTAVVTVIAQRSFVDSKRDVVQHYVDALVQALAKERNDRAFTIEEIKKLLKFDDPAGLATTYEYYSQEVHPDLPYPDAAQFEEAVKGAQNEKVRSVDIGRIIDRSFVQSAADRGLHKA